LGLPAEGLSKRRGKKLFPDLDHFHFLFGKGFCSDDTEHACMTAQALIAAANSGNDPLVFAHNLAWRLRFWLWGLPAGVGMATIKGIVKLWLGFPPDRAGANSAGNGPSMRAALLGLCHGDDPAKLRALVRASTRLTHTDPRAEMGAYSVAVAGHLAARSDDGRQLRLLERLKLDLGPAGTELIALLEQAAASAAEGQSPEDFASAIGCGTGVSGYTLHTVPVAIQVWMLHPTDFRSAIQGVIRCGGDTDTAAAITGALVGIQVGQNGIPAAWLDDLAEWPRTTAWMRALAERLALALAGDASALPLALNLPALALRNLLFLVVVLAHGFRRLLPPY
jgi:ADP-ribosylglycohydrolase